MDPVYDRREDLSAALDCGQSLPARWYTDPAILAREIETIFRRAWCYLGPRAELRTTGDYISGYAGGVPVAVVRNASGLAGFVNVCRHRRHEVLKGRGRVKVMQCGYHAWTYDLYGRLETAPRAAGEPGFRREELPLLPIRAECLGPFVFVNLDHAAAPLAACFGPLLETIAQSGVDLDALELDAREEWRAQANWKTMLENFLECYHCPVAHPAFSAAIDVRPANYHLAANGWFSSQIGEVRPAALARRSRADLYDVRGAVTQSQYHLLWPNTTISINPGFPNLAVDVWFPDGPNATRGFSEQYFAPGVDPKFARELTAFNRQVGIEDDALTDSVQRGLLGGLPECGRLLVGSESLVIHFQRLVADAVTGAGKSGHPPPPAQGRLDGVG
jgi:phenylpropionate dioxygenase-like ring-hydroxylating dioxygenase large terminal subunit